MLHVHTPGIKDIIMKFTRIALLFTLVFSSAALAEEFSLMAPGASPGIQNNNVWGIVPPSPTERAQTQAREQVRIALPPAPDVMNRPRLVEAAVNPRDGSLDFAAAIPVQTVVDYGIPGVIAPETLAVDHISLKKGPPMPPAMQTFQPAPTVQTPINLYQPETIVPPAVIRQEPAMQNSVSMQKQDDIFNFSAPQPSFSAPPVQTFQSEIPSIIPPAVSYPEYREIASPEPVSLPSLPIPTATVESRQAAAPAQVPMEGITAADFFLSGSPANRPATQQNPMGMQNTIIASKSPSQLASNETIVKNAPPSLPPELLSSLPSGTESIDTRVPTATATAKISSPEDMALAPSPEAVAAASRAVPPLTFPVTKEEISAMAPPAPIDAPKAAAPAAPLPLPVSLPTDAPTGKQSKAASSTFLPAPVEPAAKVQEEKEPMIKFRPADNPAKPGKSAEHEEPKFNMPKLSIKDSKGRSLVTEYEKPAEQKTKSQTFLSSFSRNKDIPPPLTQTQARETSTAMERKTVTPSRAYGDDTYSSKEPPLPPGMYF